MGKPRTKQQLDIDVALLRFKKDHPQFKDVEVKTTWYSDPYGPKLGPILLLFIPTRNEYYIQIGMIANNAIYVFDESVAEEMASKIARFSGAQLVVNTGGQ